VTFEPSPKLAGTPVISSLPGGRSVKKWKPIAPPTINTLSTTWRLLGSASQKPWNNRPTEKKTPSSKKRLEEVLHGQCMYHSKSNHSTFEFQALGRALGALPSARRKVKGLPN
jgi:hypothetical protein